MGSYLRFAAMIATSTIVMFALMYAHTYQLDHIYYSETRLYMALIMASSMTIIMLAFMLGMYKRAALNIGIFAAAIVLLSVSMYLMRSQILVDQVSYMKGMIPHHSIAILTSERARITDPRVRKLADDIVQSQRREIAEMKDLVRELEAR